MPGKLLKKYPLRILIATHAPLFPEYGAAQMAINLAQAFEDLGHQVILWSPCPIPKTIRSRNTILYMQESFQDYLIKEQSNFDIIDCPPFMLSKLFKKNVTDNGALIVCRSVQPDLLYSLSSISVDMMEFSWKDLIKLPFSCLIIGLQSADFIHGWSMADRIYCLGTHELKWMQKWFPFWREKLFFYYNALSSKEQENLKYLRENRPKWQFKENQSIKFLWIGRWVHHKGITKLRHFIHDWLIVRPQDIFTIAGCGDFRRSKVLLKFNESDHINIIPYFSRSELFDLLVNHDIGLFTSRVEGWGLSLNEMLESGMPVFATTAGGVEDLRSMLGGRLKSFPPTLEALSNIQISPWPDEYYKHFTWKIIAEQYLKDLIVSPVSGC
ncbi:glycosyltransferase family 4 protein [Trichothermofontia sp.]